MTDRVEWAERIEREMGSPDLPPPATRREDTTVERVEADGWTVTSALGWTFSMDRNEAPHGTEPPMEGDALTVYSSGSHVVGVDLRGERLYLRSEREVNLDWLLFRASLHRRRREEFERERPGLDRKYDALPPVLKARIDRFRADDPNFRSQDEAYEMAAVADAPKVARGIAQEYGHNGEGYPTDLDPDEAERLVTEFRDLPYEEQRRIVPDLSDGHSGNTFGAATMLAQRLLTGQEC